MNHKPALPIDELLPELLASLRRSPNLVLEASPGAGKTTRVPAALLDLVEGEVLVLEPRRIAARLAARRVAAERGEEVGETVGYQVRFEERTGPQTRLRFVTEGILARRLLTDPDLCECDAVVLDEFHERHLDSDLALALLRRLQVRRPQLLLVVMSATLDAAPIAAFLGDCPVLRSAGRQFPLAIRYTPYTPEPLHVQVRRAVQRLCADTAGQGSLLVFLPGAREIHRAMRECDSLAQSLGLRSLALYADLPAAEQDLALLPSPGRKLIFATNIAESSVTVEGVSLVIDSGLVRRASFSPWTGLPTLELTRVSRASANQRAGRAGRTGSGTALRLYPEEDFLLRAPQDPPEIARADLAQLMLHLRSMGFASADDLQWLDAPPAEAMEHAMGLLQWLGANPRARELTRRMARLPLPPRLARMVVEAVDRGVGEQGCHAAALLSRGARSRVSGTGQAAGQGTAADLLPALDMPPTAELRLEINQLLRLSAAPRQTRREDDALLLALLAGFPDRVARRRTGAEVQLANGVAAELAEGAAPGEFLLALDVEDRRDGALPVVRVSARTDPVWLLDLLPDSVHERVEVSWQEGSDRADLVRSLVYGQSADGALLLEQTRAPALGRDAEVLLLAKALEKGVEQFVDPVALQGFLVRVSFAGLPAPDLPAALAELCLGLNSFAGLRQAARHLLPLLESKLNASVLARLAPLTVQLGRGRSAKVHYEPDRPPWIESRLQDFFGMQATPRVGPLGLPLTVHLLAPNGRAMQTTTDLAGFWERLYPTVRRELMRRYPKHAWPERPLG